MVRTQIQITEAQAENLRRMAERESVSMSELVRRGLEALEQGAGPVSHEERKKRALAAVGSFRAGRTDLSEKHDKAFEDC